MGVDDEDDAGARQWRGVLTQLRATRACMVLHIPYVKSCRDRTRFELAGLERCGGRGTLATCPVSRIALARLILIK